tara:strand:- start:101 stop:430 length:330 start_codon:yes stop_codon:yes gene_type:complete
MSVLLVDWCLEHLPRFYEVADLFDECVVVNKYADPLEGRCLTNIDLDLAEEVAAADSSLLWVDSKDLALQPHLKNAGLDAECDDCGDPAPFRLHQCKPCHKRARAEAGI